METDRSHLFNSFLIFICFALLIGCGKPEGNPAALRAAVRAGSGPFNGVWAITLKPKKDTCNLGLPKSIKTTATIVQRGKKASLVLEGLPKYSGTINGSKFTASGKYNASGIKTSGTVNATLSRSKKSLTITSAKLNLKGSTSCYITFTGSGKKK